MVSSGNLVKQEGTPSTADKLWTLMSSYQNSRRFFAMVFLAKYAFDFKQILILGISQRSLKISNNILLITWNIPLRVPDSTLICFQLIKLQRIGIFKS